MSYSFFYGNIDLGNNNNIDPQTSSTFSISLTHELKLGKYWEALPLSVNIELLRFLGFLCRPSFCMGYTRYGGDIETSTVIFGKDDQQCMKPLHGCCRKIEYEIIFVMKTCCSNNYLISFFTIGNFKMLIW